MSHNPRKASRSQVGTYLGPRTFYAQDTARKHRAGQDTPLPPRCAHPGCRTSFGVVLLDGAPHCERHFNCDGECAVESEETRDA